MVFSSNLHMKASPHARSRCRDLRERHSLTKSTFQSTCIGHGKEIMWRKLPPAGVELSIILSQCSRLTASSVYNRPDDRSLPYWQLTSYKKLVIMVAMAHLSKCRATWRDSTGQTGRLAASIQKQACSLMTYIFCVWESLHGREKTVDRVVPNIWDYWRQGLVSASQHPTAVRGIQLGVRTIRVNKQGPSDEKYAIETRIDLKVLQIGWYIQPPDGTE